MQKLFKYEIFKNSLIMIKNTFLGLLFLFSMSASAETSVSNDFTWRVRMGLLSAEALMSAAEAYALHYSSDIGVHFRNAETLAVLSSTASAVLVTIASGMVLNGVKGKFSLSVEAGLLPIVLGASVAALVETTKASWELRIMNQNETNSQITASGLNIANLLVGATSSIALGAYLLEECQNRVWPIDAV